MNLPFFDGLIHIVIIYCLSVYYIFVKLVQIEYKKIIDN